MINERRITSKPVDLTGRKFGYLTAVKWAGYRYASHSSKRRWSFWHCMCSCGKESIVAAHNLQYGGTRSCGCLNSDSHKTHGATNTPEFRAWTSMKNRCSNPRDRHWPDYGGRGIRVCVRWLESFENFLADMGPRPSPKYSIDRYPNNDGNYEPGNCRWATLSEQQSNRRSCRFYTLDGETLTMEAWARRIGIDPGAISTRLERGWSLRDALTKPPQPRRRKDRVDPLSMSLIQP